MPTFFRVGRRADVTCEQPYGYGVVRQNKKHIITSRVEHPAIKNLFEQLSKIGYRVTWVPVDRHGMLDLARVKSLRDKLESAILENIPNVLLNGDKDRRLPNTLSVSFEYVEGEAILLMLDQLGICASSGSACTSGSLEPSHVLRAMGVPFTAAHGSIRLSLSVYNTDEDVDFVIDNLPAVIDRLRHMSPFWKRTACQTQ